MNENTPIREICEQYGLGQTALARRFEIPLRTVQQWYSGERKPPSYVVAMIKRILELEKGNSGGCGPDYSLVFKVEKMKTIYISGTDEFGYPLHTEDESKAFKFYDLNIAMSFYDLGYGIATKVHSCTE